MAEHEQYLSIFVGIAILVVLAIDLGVFQKKAHTLSMRAAMGWSIFWIAFALVFNFFVYLWVSERAALQFLSGYLVEKSLSVDNLFVFLLIFTYFRVPHDYQHKVLIWGIAGAIVMRGVLIWLGIQLIAEYHWLTYVLGAFLIFTGVKTATKGEDQLELEHKPILRLIRRVFPLSKEYNGSRFTVREGGRLMITPLMVVLIMIETTDLLFALDSIPAILAITQDPFILYTSNLFAILGLRALYFVLAGLLEKFHFLSYGVSLILIFVGAKMLFKPLTGELPEVVTLGAISLCLVGSAVASVIFPKAEGKPPLALEGDDPDAGGLANSKHHD